jgi:hypothetical protein
MNGLLSQAQQSPPSASRLRALNHRLAKRLFEARRYPVTLRSAVNANKTNPQI